MLAAEDSIEFILNKVEALAGPKAPGSAVPQVQEWKAGLSRADEAVGGVDGLQIGKGLPVGAEQQVVAVIDLAAELGIEIGAAASARLIGSFIECHLSTRGSKPNGGGEAGEPATDDMDFRFCRPRGHSSP